jgi:hypothetical protein
MKKWFTSSPEDEWSPARETDQSGGEIIKPHKRWFREGSTSRNLSAHLCHAGCIDRPFYLNIGWGWYMFAFKQSVFGASICLSGRWWVIPGDTRLMEETATAVSIHDAIQRPRPRLLLTGNSFQKVKRADGASLAHRKENNPDPCHP